MPADVPVLVLANCQDKDGALSTKEVADAMELREYMASKYPGRLWSCLPVSAKSGEGLKEAVHWIAERLKEQQKKEERSKNERTDQKKEHKKLAR